MKASKRGQGGADEPTSDGAVSMGRFQIMNENWRGKTDPLERRRIQNRLNQRAFRERQRFAGTGQQTDSELSPSGSNDDEFEPAFASTRPNSGQRSSNRSSSVAEASGAKGDELGQTINRNVMQAVVANCQHLEVDTQTLRSGNPITTPQQTRGAIPASLVPIKQQHVVTHDPFIDAIPHPRFRYNVLRYIASRQVDTQRLGACLRRSGTLSTVGGKQMRDGLIVWSNPESIQNWELSEAFVMNWSCFLEGCEDWIEASNWWRQRRGESPLKGN